jgi:hypothetical protein
MTTPGGSGTTQGVIAIYHQSQQAFLDAVSAMTSIVSSVLDSSQQLTTSAMVSTAGAAWGNAVVPWLDDFNDLRSTLQWMADQLGNQAQQMQNNEQNNVDLASGIQVQALPGYGQFGPR